MKRNEAIFLLIGFVAALVSIFLSTQLVHGLGFLLAGVFGLASVARFAVKRLMERKMKKQEKQSSANP